MQEQQPQQNLLQRVRSAFLRRSGAVQLVIVAVVAVALFGVGAAVGSGGASGAGASPTATTAPRASGPTATPKPTATATATPKPKAWTTIKHFNGTSNTQTDTFSIPDGAHLVWTCKVNDAYGGGNFIVTLYTSDGQTVDLVANATGNQNGTYTLHNGSGSYYFSVDTFSESWTVDIQVYL